MEKLLDGIKVADFSWWMAGPVATKVLADCGAEVIKVEGRTKPDLQRTQVPVKDGISGVNRSGDFNQYNTGKVSIALNISLPKGVEVAKRLVAWADVVVENFAAGVMKRMGLDYEELRKVKPDIIMLSSCMHGQTGPHAAHPGFGWHLTAESGFYQIVGWPDRAPAGLEGPYTDFLAPRFSVVAIVAAILYRRRTGKGQYIDLSQYETGVHCMAVSVLDYLVNNRVADRTGNRHPYAAPHAAYRCLGDDRWCVIAVFTEDEWRSFCRVIGTPAWTKDARFAALKSRKQNEDELDRLVEEWTIRHSADQVMKLMQAAEVGAGVVEHGRDLLENDPQLRHRHSYSEIDHAEIGKYHAPGTPFISSEAPCEISRAPMLGEHNDYVLREILHMSDNEIVDLITQGVIE